MLSKVNQNRIHFISVVLFEIVWIYLSLKVQGIGREIKDFIDNSFNTELCD